MEFISKILTKSEVAELRRMYGDYVKLTVDVANEWIVAGGELHADGEKVLLEKGSKQGDIWGGGIDFVSKQVDTTAVLNIRPRFDNDNLEILDPVIRNKFRAIIRKFFSKYGVK